MSPDGKWVVVEVLSADPATGAISSDLWVLSTDGKTQKPLTSHPGRETDPQWSPDGKWICFAGKRADDLAPQIYLVNPVDGQTRRLTQLATGVAALKWLPDGTGIGFLSSVWPDLELDQQQQRLTERNTNPIKAHLIEKTIYRAWDRWVDDGRVVHVLLADVQTGACRDLMAGLSHSVLSQDPVSLTSASYDFSSDGRELAYDTDLSADPGIDNNRDILTIPIGGGNFHNRTSDNEAHDGLPAYSPDGQWLAYLRQSEKGSVECNQVTLINRHTGERRILTGAWDRSPSALAWHPNSQLLYLSAEEHARRKVWSCSLRTGQPAAIVSEGTNAPFVLSRDGKTLVYQHSTLSVPPVLIASTPEGKKARRIESFNDSLVAGWQLGNVQEITFTGASREPVQMWVIYPPGFDPARKYPLVHLLHGGYAHAWVDGFQLRWCAPVFAAPGRIVAIVNFHGSSGWGKNFANSVRGRLGEQELEDINLATNHLLATGYVDSMRMAAGGGSYGGYLSNLLNGRSRRFQALFSHAGVYEFAETIEAMDENNVLWTYRAGAKSWENPEKLQTQSPHYYARQFRTPALISHGELDYRVPVTGSLRYYGVLKRMGIPARLLYFPDENHWINKPLNSRLWYQEILGWLEKYTPAEKTGKAAVSTGSK
jgi:dipeptidyl aminopeptidase/acylaminoacyl peptidase